MEDWRSILGIKHHNKARKTPSQRRAMETLEERYENLMRSPKRKEGLTRTDKIRLFYKERDNG